MTSKIIIMSIAFLSISMVKNNLVNHSDAAFKSEFIEREAAFAKASCFCRIGDDVGPRPDEYPNSLKDFGRLKTYKGLRPMKQKNQDDCSRLCAIKAQNYLNSLSGDQLCQLKQRTGQVRVLAYSKVGTKNWTVCGAAKDVNCCSSGGTTICDGGWGPEDTNFPGYCSQALCPPLVKGDRRLYNENGSVWGFIWQDMMYQLKKGKTSSVSYHACR